MQDCPSKNIENISNINYSFWNDFFTRLMTFESKLPLPEQTKNIMSWIGSNNIRIDKIHLYNVQLKYWLICYKNFIDAREL